MSPYAPMRFCNFIALTILLSCSAASASSFDANSSFYAEAQNSGVGIGDSFVLVVVSQNTTALWDSNNNALVGAIDDHSFWNAFAATDISGNGSADLQALGADWKALVETSGQSGQDNLGSTTATLKLVNYLGYDMGLVGDLLNGTSDRNITYYADGTPHSTNVLLGSVWTGNHDNYNFANVNDANDNVMLGFAHATPNTPGVWNYRSTARDADEAFGIYYAAQFQMTDLGITALAVVPEPRLSPLLILLAICVCPWVGRRSS